MGQPSTEQMQQQTYESIEVASVTEVADELADMTPIEWFVLASMICGGLLLIACFVRFTPFSKGVSNLFSTLAKLASKKDKNEPDK